MQIDRLEFERTPQPLDEERIILERWFTCAASGTPEVVARGLAGFAEQTGVDEIMVTSNIHDHAARLRSYEITAEVGAALSHEPATREV